MKLSTIKNTLKTVALAAPFVFSTMGFSQDKQQGYDAYYSFNDIIKTEFQRRRIQNPSRKDTIDVYRDVIGAFEKNADKKGHYFVEGIGINYLDGDMVKAELLTGTYLRDVASVKEILSESDYPWLIKKAVANDYAKPVPVSEPVVNKKSNFFKNLGFGYVLNFRSFEDEGTVFKKESSSVLASIPLGLGNLNLETALTLNDNVSVDELTRTVLKSEKAPSGRVYELVQYGGNNNNFSFLGSLGLSYTFAKDGNYPFTIGGGTNVVLSSNSSFDLQREEVFFNGGYVGQGTTPKDLMIPQGNSNINFQGYNAFVRFGALAKGVQLQLGANIIPNNSKYNSAHIGVLFTPGRSIFSKSNRNR